MVCLQTRRISGASKFNFIKTKQARCSKSPNSSATEWIISTEHMDHYIAPELQVFPQLYHFGLAEPIYHGRPLENFYALKDYEEYAESILQSKISFVYNIMLTTEVYDCGPLSAAILAKSKVHVDKILANSQEAINERNKDHQTPLHLSAGWPWGIDRLLSAGASVNVTDRYGHHPIHYARIGRCLNSVERFVAADSPMVNLRDLLPPRHYSHEGDHAVETLQQQMFYTLVTALAERRRQLAELAKNVLVSSDYEVLLGSIPGLPDRTAYRIYKKILASGISVPPALQVSEKHFSVYHCVVRLKSEEADVLYNAGFCDIDVLDDGGETPLIRAARWLMISYDLRVCQWFISKGADLLKKAKKKGNVQIHFLASGIADCARQSIKNPFRSRSFDGGTQKIAQLLPFMEFVLREDCVGVSDDCLCECSVHGCSSLIFLFRPIWPVFWSAPCWICKNESERIFGHLDEPFLAQCVSRYRKPLFALLERGLEAVYGRQHLPDTITAGATRLFLFVELDLTHTCCRWERPWYRGPSSQGRVRWGPDRPGPEEISEIQDEERELIEELNSLCEEASIRRADYQGSFTDFLQEFLQEVHGRKPKPISKKDRRKMEEIGVVFQPGTVVECDSAEDSEEEVEDHLEEETEDNSDDDAFEDAAAEVGGEDGE